MAALPFSMSLGAAVNYLIKRKVTPVALSSARSGFAKLDANAFADSWSQVPFRMNLGNDGRSLNGLAVKLSDGHIVAYSAEHPEWGCSLVLDKQSGNGDANPVLRCHCHEGSFDITNGAALNGSSRESLKAFRIKHCHEKVCVILEDVHANLA
jgi:nitrite reductase/ring-hydroxylating ferredoxin subunit